MKYGIHYAYWQHEWKADLAAACRRASALGFDLLEISGGSLLDSGEEELRALRRTADGLGMGVNACHGMSKDCDTGSADPAVRARGIDTAKRLFDRMALIGSSRLGGILYSYWPALDYTNAGAEPARTREYSLESMAVIADEAASRSIQLNLEVVNRYENFVFNDVDGALAYITELGRGNVKLLLDVFHMNIEEDDIGAAIRRAGAAVGHFHIGECNRRVPGKGHMPWADIGAALRDIGYDGPVVMEPFVRSGGEVADAIRVWHDLTRPDSDARLDEDLKQALSFTRSMLYSEN